MNCPYCGARATHNGDAYHCGTGVDFRQSKQCEKDSGHVAPFRYMPPDTGAVSVELTYSPSVDIPAPAGIVMTDEYEKELREIFSAVLETKGRVPKALRARIRKFLGDE